MAHYRQLYRHLGTRIGTNRIYHYRHFTGKLWLYKYTYTYLSLTTAGNEKYRHVGSVVVRGVADDGSRGSRPPHTSPVAVPGGHLDHAPPQKPIPGANISFAPNRSRASWTRLGPQLTSIFFQVSGPRGKNQGSAERTRTLRDKSGSRNGSGPRNTNQDPAIRIRVQRDGSGSDGPGPRGPKQDPARRIRAGRTK